jgi:hypothetical protein
MSVLLKYMLMVLLDQGAPACYIRIRISRMVRFSVECTGAFRFGGQGLAASDFQMCTHAIGDSGNRTILHIYARYLKGKNDRRWRIEHAQVVNPADFILFGKYNIVPSVQPTHATSDMYWAADRLGAERVKNALMPTVS